MQRFNSRGFQPLTRAIMVISSVAVLATGVTFAAFQSQTATLTGNSIKSASADLRIGTSVSTFSESRTGFLFDGLIPGGSAVPTDGNNFYLRNYGSVPLSLKVSIGTIPTNVAAVDLTKVFVTITRVDTTTSQKLALADLIASHGNGGMVLTDTLATGTTPGHFRVQASMDEDAYTGNTAAVISGIDIVFVGSAITQ